MRCSISYVQAILHPEAHEDGGFGFTNKELLARQRGVMTDIIKEVTSNSSASDFLSRQITEMRNQPQKQ